MVRTAGWTNLLEQNDVGVQRVPQDPNLGVDLTSEGGATARSGRVLVLAHE